MHDSLVGFNSLKKRFRTPGSAKSAASASAVTTYALPHHVRTVRYRGCTRTYASDLIRNPYANAIMQFADALRHLFDNIPTTLVKQSVTAAVQ
jgi:hypothetical protein